MPEPVGERSTSRSAKMQQLAWVEPAQLEFAYRFGASRLYLVFYAAVFLIVILLLPRGIVPSVTDLFRGWRRRRQMGP